MISIWVIHLNFFHFFLFGIHLNFEDVLFLWLTFWSVGMHLILNSVLRLTRCWFGLERENLGLSVAIPGPR